MLRRCSSQLIGINKAIVNILTDYNKEIPVDFLARELCRDSSEIQEPLKNLKEQKIVKIHDGLISI